MLNGSLELWRLTGERCVWVTKNWTNWACEHGQITKTRLSDGCAGETIPMTVKIGYCRSRFDGYLGNVRLMLKQTAASARETSIRHGRSTGGIHHAEV